jgi:glutamate N-acetyltransferase/amino-acid N-acetyltransferase
VSQIVDGGVTTPKGFRAAGVYCGIKKTRLTATGQENLDLALVAADGPVSAAAVFTTNRAVAAPVVVSREHLTQAGGRAAARTNSGCANACTGEAGLQVAREMAGATARAVGCRPEQVLVASTGVIGVQLDLEKIRSGVEAASALLSVDGGPAATRAIMTTDPFPKSCAITVDGPAGAITVGGMAKGSGMIEPRMATMLGYLTTDASIEPAVLSGALRRVVSGRSTPSR